MYMIIHNTSSVQCWSYYTIMASSGNIGHKKKWWRSPNTFSSKKILLLLMWNMFLKFSREITSLYGAEELSEHFYLILNLVPLALAPIIGWLADVRFGRYEIIKFGALISFLSSILYYIQLFIGRGSTLTTVLYSVAVVVQGICAAFFVAAMLPFLTD